MIPRVSGSTSMPSKGANTRTRTRAVRSVEAIRSTSPWGFQCLRSSSLRRCWLEWENTLAIREHAFGALGVRVCGELFDEIRRSTGDAQDVLLYELLVLARGGDKIAERVLVQILIPVAQRMAHRVRSLADRDRVDRVGYAISCAWEMTARYRLHLRRRVHANLTMGLLDLLTEKSMNDRLIADRTTPTSDEVLEEVAGAWKEPDAPVEVLAARLFSWAVDTEVLTREETALLARISLGDERQVDIAAELGIKVDCLNKRVTRARRRLKQAYVANF